MRVYFDHEKLDVYQEAIRFVSWADDLLRSVPGAPAAKDHLDRASTSVPLNIAEGNGKFSIKDRCRFLDHAYGSAVECAGCLDVLWVKKLIAEQQVEEGKKSLHKIVSMLVTLRESLASRVCEESAEYGVPDE